MTIREAVAILQKEKQAGVQSRFPCRAIMVKNIRQYSELLSELRKISDVHVVQSSELFTNADVLPKYDNLKAAKYRDKWIVLTGVSEYLRLFLSNEITDRRFSDLWHYQAPATSKGRIIIPLWGCEAQWFDKNLNLNDDLRQEEFYYDCIDPNETEQKLSISILSGTMEKYVGKLDKMKGILKVGLQDWFEYWEDPALDREKLMLLTKRSRSVNATNGAISVRVISDMLALIREYMPGTEVLSRNNCDEEMQSMLLEYALNGETLRDALLSILNVSAFSGIDVMGKWSALSYAHKQFVKLWFAINPDNTYLSHCFSVTEDLSKLSDAILLEIFKSWTARKEWIQEYRELVKVMALKPNTRFFKELDAIPTNEQKLTFITGNDRSERIYLLKMVGKWLKTDRAQAMSSAQLKEIYPELYAYLDDDGLAIDSDIKHYMAKYKAYKLSNSLPDDEETYFNGIQTDVYDKRYAVLSEFIDSDTIVLWIDALGIEWLPLLYWSLSKNCDASIKNATIGLADLPTETEFNDQWNRMTNPYEKLDKLDKLAHKGVVDEPDYYACVQEQLAFISEIHSKVSKLLEQYHRVIITGDHGTSRLAARFFHNRDGEFAPKGARVCSHGRYCILQPGTQITMPFLKKATTLDGSVHAVFVNYDHFKQSGFAAGADDDNAIYGEVHGGATPEESLVPVIVIDSNHDIPLSGKWENDTVKIKMKKVKLSISFNKPVKDLQISISGVSGDATCTSDQKKWNVVFSGVKEGTYTPQVVADFKILSMPEIIVKPAMGGGDGDLL